MKRILSFWMTQFDYITTAILFKIEKFMSGNTTGLIFFVLLI